MNKINFKNLSINVRWIYLILAKIMKIEVNKDYVLQKSGYIITKDDYCFNNGIESGNPSVITIPKDRRPSKK